MLMLLGNPRIKIVTLFRRGKVHLNRKKNLDKSLADVGHECPQNAMLSFPHCFSVKYDNDITRACSGSRYLSKPSLENLSISENHIGYKLVNNRGFIVHDIPL